MTVEEGSGGPVVVTCAGCGEVPVDGRDCEIHLDPDGRVALFTFTCPGCHAMGSGGCRELIARLLASGAVRRDLKILPGTAITEREIRAFTRWLDADPRWELPRAP